MRLIVTMVFSAASLFFIQTTNAVEVSSLKRALANGEMVSILTKTELDIAKSASPKGVYVVTYDNDDVNADTIHTLVGIAKSYAGKNLFVKISREEANKALSRLGQETFAESESVSLGFVLPKSVPVSRTLAVNSNASQIAELCTTLPGYQASMARVVQNAHMKARLDQGQAWYQKNKEKLFQQSGDKHQAQFRPAYVSNP